MEEIVILLHLREGLKRQIKVSASD
jgi:hypothetical protein